MATLTKRDMQNNARKDIAAGQAERKAREARLEDQAVRVLVALAERDQAIAKCENEVGMALLEMTDVEGLGLREALTWCADKVTEADAKRLKATATRAVKTAKAEQKNAGTAEPSTDAKVDFGSSAA